MLQLIYSISHHPQNMIEHTMFSLIPRMNRVTCKDFLALRDEVNDVSVGTLFRMVMCRQCPSGESKNCCSPCSGEEREWYVEGSSDGKGNSRSTCPPSI